LKLYKRELKSCWPERNHSTGMREQSEGWSDRRESADQLWVFWRQWWLERAEAAVTLAWHTSGAGSYGLSLTEARPSSGQSPEQSREKEKGELTTRNYCIHSSKVLKSKGQGGYVRLATPVWRKVPWLKAM
jgi:hypothetical protein